MILHFKFQYSFFFFFHAMMSSHLPTNPWLFGSNYHSCQLKLYLWENSCLCTALYYAVCYVQYSNTWNLVFALRPPIPPIGAKTNLSKKEKEKKNPLLQCIWLILIYIGKALFFWFVSTAHASLQDWTPDHLRPLATGWDTVVCCLVIAPNSLNIRILLYTIKQILHPNCCHCVEVGLYCIYYVDCSGFF